MVITAKYGCTSTISRRSFLAGLGALARSVVYGIPHVRARSAPEKGVLKFGFIKLTDCAPLVIAYEKQFFDDEGLLVSLEAPANWKVLLDRVIDGQLDGAHMLAGQPLGAAIGIGTQAHIITAFSMDLNGNATTVSNEVWQDRTGQCTVQAGHGTLEWEAAACRHCPGVCPVSPAAAT